MPDQDGNSPLAVARPGQPAGNRPRRRVLCAGLFGLNLKVVGGGSAWVSPPPKDESKELSSEV